MAELDILQRAEIQDGYRAACAKSPLNWAARKEQTYDLTTISEAAAASLTDAARSVPLTRNCEFAILDATADGGMPHTRAANIICLPTNLCKEGRASKGFLETLAHEAIHVHQRRSAAAWRQALATAGWEPLDPAKIPAEISSRLRINPDTMASPLWSWNSHHVPLPLFSAKISPTLGDARISWIDLRSGILLPTPPPSFNKVSSQNGSAISAALEHPYEFYAYMLSERGICTQGALEDALRSL